MTAGESTATACISNGNAAIPITQCSGSASSLPYLQHLAAVLCGHALLQHAPPLLLQLLRVAPQLLHLRMQRRHLLLQHILGVLQAEQTLQRCVGLAKHAAHGAA